MLRIAGLSLAMGSIALIAGLQLFFAPGTVSPGPITPVEFDPRAVLVFPETDKRTADSLEFELSPLGLGAVALNKPDFEAGNYPFLNISVDLARTAAPEALSIKIVWSSNEDGLPRHSYQLEKQFLNSQWIATAEIPNWNGKVKSLSLVFLGQPGDTVVVNGLALLPPSIWYQLRAISTDWSGFLPWNRAAMNTHSGVSKVSSFYPAPLTAAFLVLSLISYGLLLLLARTRLKFNWQVVAAIFLACWMVLDFKWQSQLLHQLSATYRTFAGKSTPEKLAVGPDAGLYAFATAAKEHIPAEGTRVFVSSSDEYNGLRVAYYLYPLNVYWSYHGPELPHDFFLQSGDYIVVVQPSKLSIDHHRNKVIRHSKPPLEIESLYQHPLGKLVRIN